MVDTTLRLFLSACARAARGDSRCSVSMMGPPFVSLCTVDLPPSRPVSFTRHPCPHVPRTIAQHDAIALARAQEANGTFIDNDQFLQVQDDTAPPLFCIKQSGQFVQVAGLEAPADREHNVPVGCALDLQHVIAQHTVWQSSCQRHPPEYEGVAGLVIGEISSIDQKLDNARTGQDRKRFLLMPNARIFDSSVERGMHNLAAAPDGPNTRPPVARSASSIIAFS